MGRRDTKTQFSAEGKLTVPELQEGPRDGAGTEEGDLPQGSRSPCPEEQHPDATTAWKTLRWVYRTPGDPHCYKPSKAAAEMASLGVQGFFMSSANVKLQTIFLTTSSPFC